MQASKNRKRGALVGAAVMMALCGAAAPALADHDNGRPRRGIEVTRVDLCEQDAGRLQINRKIFEIGGERPLMNVLEAFRLAGFRAWSDGKRVFVRMDCERPALAWTSELYNAEFSYRDDCLVVLLCPAEPEIVRSKGRWDRERGKSWKRGHGEQSGGWRVEFGKTWGINECVQESISIGRPIIPVRIDGRHAGMRVSVNGR